MCSVDGFISLFRLFDYVLGGPHLCGSDEGSSGFCLVRLSRKQRCLHLLFSPGGLFEAVTLRL